MTKADYLIVGQGLAGTVLAHALIKNGQKVVVTDRPNSSAASQVAAGIFNPVTGRRIVKTWQAETLFDHLTTCYQGMQQSYGGAFFEKRSVYRPFATIAEQNYGLSRIEQEAIASVVKPNNQTDHQLHSRWTYNHLGGFETLHGARLDIPAMLQVFRHYLVKNNQLITVTEPAQPADFMFKDDEVMWKNRQLSVRKVIWCGGWHDSLLADLDKLKFTPVKGELLHLEPIEHQLSFPETVYVGGGIYAFATAANHWVTGATYDKQNLDTDTTEAAKTELLEKVEQLIKMKFKVVRQVAGIRPAVADRKPVVGVLPDKPGLAVFNGMGTKGISLAPWLAKCMTNHLLQGKPLPPEVSIGRFYKK